MNVIATLEGHKVLNNKTRTKHKTSTNNGSNHKQYINNNRTTTLEQTAPLATAAGGGLHAFYWYQILVLGYFVVKVQQLFDSHVKINCFCYRYPGSCLSEKVSIRPCNICKELYLLTFYIFKK